MKKIGILTYFTDIPYFNDINPGMNLQGFGVLQALKDAYPNDCVEFIRYHSWLSIWKPYLSCITLRSLMMDFSQLNKYIKFSQDNFPKSKKKFVGINYSRSSEFIESLDYDAIYVGSDTLLELFRAPKDSLTAYWLSPKIKAKKFMIAASSRDTSYETLSEKQKDKIQLSVDAFSDLGIRDKATYDLISNFVKRNDPRLKIIPDPTFYFNIDYRQADEYAQKSGIANSKKPIICFHLTRSNVWMDELADIFHNEGYLIASLRPYKKADFLLKDLSPLEFAGIFKYFKFTLTHRFHDSVFSIKSMTPVLVYLPSATYKNNNGDSKQSSLMDAFGLRDTNYIDDINAMSTKEIRSASEVAIKTFLANFEVISKKLNLYKQDFWNYVKETKLLV